MGLNAINLRGSGGRRPPLIVASPYFSPAELCQNKQDMTSVQCGEAIINVVFHCVLCVFAALRDIFSRLDVPCPHRKAKSQFNFAALFYLTNARIRDKLFVEYESLHSRRFFRSTLNLSPLSRPIFPGNKVEA